jgi:hypothetical protein
VKPGALTQAARNAAARRDGAQPRHQSRPKRPTGPPRRVSGPAGGKPTPRAARAAGAFHRTPVRGPGSARGGSARGQRSVRAQGSPRGATTVRIAGAARAAAVALPLPLPAFRRAPAPIPRPRPRPAPAPRERESQHGGFAGRLGAFVVSLPDHPWIDRLVRGRAWIPLLGILLAGIVAAQVEILKAGATMGRALEQTSTLINQNEQLRGNVAALGDDQRIEHIAGAMGLVLPPPGAVGYLVAGRGGNVSGALANLHAPDSSAFVMMTPKNGALVTGQGTSTLPPTPGAPAPSPPTTSTTGTAGTTGATNTTGATGTTGATSASITTGTTGATSTGTGTAATSSITSSPSSTSAGTSSTTGTAATTSASPTTTQATSQMPATGAAAIQPAGSTQSSSGG